LKTDIYITLRNVDICCKFNCNVYTLCGLKSYMCQRVTSCCSLDLCYLCIVVFFKYWCNF